MYVFHFTMRFQRKDKLAKAAIVIHETSNILYIITTTLYIRTSKNDSSLSNKERGELFYGYWAVSKTWFLRSILSHSDVKIVIHDGFSITSSWYYNPRTWVHIYYCMVQRELKEIDRWYYKCNVKAVIQHYIIILLAWHAVTAGWVLIMNCCYRRNVFHVNTF